MAMQQCGWLNITLNTYNPLRQYVLCNVCCITTPYFGSRVSPKSHVLKGLVPNVVLLGGDESFMRWGQREVSGSLVVCL